MVDLEQRLRRIEEDTYCNVSPEVIENVRKFLKLLPTLPDPDDVTPTPYGSVCIDYKNKGSIEIGYHQIGWFMLEGQGSESNGVETDFTSIPEDLWKLF